MAGFYALKALNSAKQSVSFSQFQGKAVLVVNVASKCGYTKQYAGLQELFAKYESQGLVVLGFPCNQFGGQEPGSNEEIQQFCSLKFGVNFPIFDKVEVNGPNTHEVFQFLKTQVPGDIPWNFSKFLISRNGKVVKRYNHKTTPAEIEKDLPLALNPSEL